MAQTVQQEVGMPLRQVSSSNIDVGTLIQAPFAPNSKWLLCDGSIYPNASYPALAAVLANNYTFKPKPVGYSVPPGYVYTSSSNSLATPLITYSGGFWWLTDGTNIWRTPDITAQPTPWTTITNSTGYSLVSSFNGPLAMDYDGTNWMIFGCWRNAGSYRLSMLISGTTCAISANGNLASQQDIGFFGQWNATSALGFLHGHSGTIYQWTHPLSATCLTLSTFTPAASAAPVNNNSHDICYLSSARKWVYLDSGNGSLPYFAGDSLTGTATALTFTPFTPTVRWNAIASNGNNLAVMVGGGYTIGRTTNGTQVTVLTDNTPIPQIGAKTTTSFVPAGLADVTYHNSLGLFVAVGAPLIAGAGLVIWTSPDGLVWTAQKPPAGTNQYSSVPHIFSTSEGIIITPGNITNGIICSKDAVNWQYLDYGFGGPFYLNTSYVAGESYLGTNDGSYQMLLPYSSGGTNSAAMGALALPTVGAGNFVVPNFLPGAGAFASSGVDMGTPSALPARYYIRAIP